MLAVLLENRIKEMTGLKIYIKWNNFLHHVSILQWSAANPLPDYQAFVSIAFAPSFALVNGPTSGLYVAVRGAVGEDLKVGA